MLTHHQTITTEVNEGYEERLARLVAFNGERVRNLAHLEVSNLIGVCIYTYVCVYIDRWIKMGIDEQEWQLQSTIIKSTNQQTHPCSINDILNETKTHNRSSSKRPAPRRRTPPGSSSTWRTGSSAGSFYRPIRYIHGWAWLCHWKKSNVRPPSLHPYPHPPRQK